MRTRTIVIPKGSNPLDELENFMYELKDSRIYLDSKVLKSIWSQLTIVEYVNGTNNIFFSEKECCISVTSNPNTEAMVLKYYNYRIGKNYNVPKKAKSKFKVIMEEDSKPKSKFKLLMELISLKLAGCRKTPRFKLD